MFKLSRLSALLLAGFLSLSFEASAACPDYLDQDMRRLHSKDDVNLCSVTKGRPALLVNTASHCGYTPQFKGLESLHQAYKERGLVVIGFASDSFNQEAASEEKAADVCFVNFGVSFTMLAPTSVKGDDSNAVFKELSRQSGQPKWNFNKYLIDGNGKVVEHFDSGTRPNSRKLTQAIETVL
ncbi:MAG: glutathione peroxidase [Pseudomonadota bacterium]